jgi:DNA-binding response OmpR family regulator
MNKKKILYIEDDPNLRSGLALALSSDQIEVIEASSIRIASELFQERTIDLILLDVNLPDGNGFDLCKYFRLSSNIPIIFLTVNDTEIDMVSAFRLGAVDYVTKPFSIMVLRERILLALRQSGGKDTIFSQGNFQFNFSTYEYQVSGETVILSTVEQKILKLLVSNSRRIIPRERMIDAVWSVEGEFIDDNALTAAVKRLRSKIGANAIKTVYGLGYMWAGDEK